MRFLADMALFVEVANTRHFGRAAAALGMPASTLSRRVASLEKELGISLVNRSTRSFALTEGGYACYQRAEKLVAEAKRLREEVGQNTHGLSGHLRIGLPADLAMTIFFPLFAGFARANPGVSIEVLTVPGYPNLVTEALDVAFLVAHQTSLPDSSHATRRIGTFSRMLFASKLYLKRRGVPQDPRDLEDHDCLLFSMGTIQKQWELRRRKEKQIVTVNGIGSANSVGVLAQFAREHLGIAALPHFLARHSTYGGGLERVLPEWEATPAHIFALTASRMIPAKVSKLLEATKAGFNERLSRCEAG